MEKINKTVEECQVMHFNINFISRYEAGDHVAVYPSNDTELVEKLGSLLNVDLDAIISLKNTDGKVNITITVSKMLY